MQSVPARVGDWYMARLGSEEAENPHGVAGLASDSMFLHPTSCPLGKIHMKWKEKCPQILGFIKSFVFF